MERKKRGGSLSKSEAKVALSLIDVQVAMFHDIILHVQNDQGIQSTGT